MERCKGGRSKTVTKTYDAAGNKATEGYPSGASLSLAFAWNDIDNLSSISDGTNTIASDAWIGVRRKTETFQSGAKRTNWYTGFRREVESVRHETSGSSTILRLDYGYNAVHDRTYERFGASGAAGDAFEYDKLRRLTVAWMGSTTPTSPSGNPYVTKIQYNMDDDGNRTSVVTTPYGGSASTSSYSTNNLNEYTSVGGTSQSSDANGNLTDNGTYLFLYDYRNHIVQVKLKSSGSVIASYRYDALGRRVEKNVDGTVERHVLSIRNAPGVVEDLSHVVSVYDGSDVWRQNFVWSDEVDGIQMLEQKDVLDYDSDGNTTEVTRSFYHRNALGSVMEITDLNQTSVVSYRYGPYGEVTITRGGTPQSSDPLGNHWTFTGRFLDEEAGLLYYRARYYDPSSGRFIQRDPRRYAEGPNLFTYVKSSPMNRSDPTGHGEDPLPDPSPAVEPPEETPEEQLEQDVEDYLDDPEAGPAPAGGFEELQKKLKGQEEGGTPVPPTLPLPPVEYPPFGPGGLESIDLTVPFFPPPPPPPDIPDLPEPDLGPPSLFGWTFEGGSGVSKLFDWFRIIIGPPMEPAVPDPDAPPLGIQIGVTIVVDF